MVLGMSETAGRRIWLEGVKTSVCNWLDVAPKSLAGDVLCESQRLIEFGQHRWVAVEGGACLAFNCILVYEKALPMN